mmetsp:Transcript_32165/g.47514  ORF Transcript_32165/g.47514 Transcript_32165/m.47514 type:complete len:563 (+) Transcript_32165:159-1847(+)
MKTLDLLTNTLSLKSEWFGKTKGLPHHRSNAAGGKTEDGIRILTGGLNKNQEPKRNAWLYQNGKWDIQTLPRINIARSSHGCAIVNNKVYVLGGRNRNGHLIKSVEMLDLKNPQNGWMFVSPMKYARAPLAVAAVAGSSFLYIFGSSGEKENRSVERLDLSANEWKSTPHMPHTPSMLAIFGAAVVGDKIYLLGPKANQKKNAPADAAIVFDPSSKSWTRSEQSMSLKFDRSGSVFSGAMMFVKVKDNDDLDEDDDDEESSGKVLTLDMIPPVDPKFATQLSKMQEMSTSELLDAYATNSAAMYQNGYELYSNALNTQNQADDEDEESSQSSFSVQAPVSSRLQEQAQAIREKLVAKFPEKALELLNEEGPPSDPSEMLQKRRGQRYRTSRGGVRTNLKRTIQTNLNINWSDTIRNFVLFLFFGIFGGRNSVSRNLLILGAPLCFVLQARPMKLALKQLFYFCSRPPGILLSLLSAPQQAILNFLQDVELQAVYGIERKADLDDEMMKGGEFDEEESSILESLANVDDEEETDDTTDDEYDDEEETDISEEVEESDDETDED